MGTFALRVDRCKIYISCLLETIQQTDKLWYPPNTIPQHEYALGQENARDAHVTCVYGPTSWTDFELRNHDHKANNLNIKLGRNGTARFVTNTVR